MRATVVTPTAPGVGAYINIDTETAPARNDTYGTCISEMADVYRAVTAVIDQLEPGHDRPHDAVVAYCQRTFANAEQLARDDVATALGTRRWILERPDPDTYLPGDVVALRVFSIGDLLADAATVPAVQGRITSPEAFVEEVAFWVLGMRIVGGIYDAVPHFLDSAAAHALIGAEPPAPELIATLRLPFPRVLIFFDHALHLPAHLEAFDADNDGQVLSRSGPARASIDHDHAVASSRVEGVVLTAGEDGIGLSDHIIWLVSLDPTDANGAMSQADRRRSYIGGSLAHAGAAAAIYNLAAAVAYTDWTEPHLPTNVPEPGSKEFFKTLTHNKTRRAEQAGAYAGVRVIDMARTAKRAEADRHDATRSVSTHLRRGHWRSVRVAARNAEGVIVGNVQGEQGVDWHYRGVFIPPTLVNPAGVGMRTPVYLVDPDAAR